MKSLTQKIEYGIVSRMRNKYKSYAGAADDLTGAAPVTIDMADSVTGWTVSSTTSGNSRVADKSVEAARGYGDVLKVVLDAATSYVEFDIGSGQDWSGGDAADDNILFWMRADRVTAGTDFDLELRNSSGTLITDASYNVTAIAVASRWQLISLDASNETLDDVQYVRLVKDVATKTTLWLDSVVRTHAETISTKGYYKDLLLSTEMDGQCNYLELFCENGTAAQFGKIYINSLANDPIYFQAIMSTKNELVFEGPINAFFLCEMDTDASVDWFVNVGGRF